MYIRFSEFQAYGALLTLLHMIQIQNKIVHIDK